jgi:hypothetical protein
MHNKYPNVNKEEWKQVKSAPNQIGPKSNRPQSNRPQVKIIEELKLSSKYSYVLYQ